MFSDKYSFARSKTKADNLSQKQNKPYKVSGLWNQKQEVTNYSAIIFRGLSFFTNRMDT